jgi:hypothetical protein
MNLKTIDADRYLSHIQTICLPYKEWAENHIVRIKGALNGACADHMQAVKDHINEVGQMKDVVSLTKQLFEMSKVRTPPSLLISCQSCSPFGYRRLQSPGLTHLYSTIIAAMPK